MHTEKPSYSAQDQLPLPEERLAYLQRWMSHFSVRLGTLGFREILDLGSDFRYALFDLHALENIEKLEADYRRLILRIRHFEQLERKSQ